MMFINHFHTKTCDNKFDIQIKILNDHVASEDLMTRATLNPTSAKYLSNNSHFCFQPRYFRGAGHITCSAEVVVKSRLEFRKMKMLHFVKKKNWAIV